MEAAAISEMAENSKNDAGLPRAAGRLEPQRAPRADARMDRRHRRSPITRRLRAQGHDLKALGARLMQTFLRHAMRDGFFHADMHPGNLFVDDQGRIVAVDFGIMGRLGLKERRFLAEILHGFITRELPARGRGAFRGRLRAAPSFGRAVRPGLARHRRADHGPAGERDLHGAAAGPALPIHRSVRHADAARAAAAAKDHGGGRRRRPEPRPRAQYLGGGRARGEGLDAERSSAPRRNSRLRRKARCRSASS